MEEELPERYISSRNARDLSLMPMCFPIVRYSILSAKGGGFRTYSPDIDEYRKRLFAPERMSRREFLFENVLLQSLKAQTKPMDPSWVKLFVLTSMHLPAENRRILEEMLAPYPWAEIITDTPEHSHTEILRQSIAVAIQANAPRKRRKTSREPWWRLWKRMRVKPEQVPPKKIRRIVPYMTHRIDDDDALSMDFFRRTQKLNRKLFINSCISFSRGYAALLDGGGRMVEFRELIHVNAAQGLTHVGGFDLESGEFTTRIWNVFRAGPHRTVHLRGCRTIIDCRKPSFIRTLYRGQDSNAAEGEQARGEIVPRETVEKAFSLSPAML